MKIHTSVSTFGLLVALLGLSAVQAEDTVTPAEEQPPALHSTAELGIG